MGASPYLYMAKEKKECSACFCGRTLFFYILDVEVYFLEPCFGVKARTLLLDARQVSVAQDHGIGEVEADALEQLLHRYLLG